MPSISERVRDIRSTYRTDNNLDPKLATIITKNGQMQDPLIPGNYWIAYPTSNGLSTVRSVGGPAKVLPLKPGTPVILERFRGKLRIKELDPQRALASAQDVSGDLQYQKNDSTPQGRFETLRLLPKSGLTVSLRSWNIIIGGVYKEFSYPDIDLTADVPSAGQKRYATIFVKSDLATIEIVDSTARGLIDMELDDSDVNECIAAASVGSTPTWAVKLIGGQTGITQDDIDNDAKDLRQIVNGTDATYRATASTTDATVTSLFVLTIPAGVSVTIKAKVTARRTGGSSGSAGDSAGYERIATVADISGTATLVGSVSTPHTAESQAGWDCTIDVTGATARVRITGASNNDISWSGTIDVEQVS